MLHIQFEFNKMRESPDYSGKYVRPLLLWPLDFNCVKTKFQTLKTLSEFIKRKHCQESEKALKHALVAGSISKLCAISCLPSA